MAMRPSLFLALTLLLVHCSSGELPGRSGFKVSPLVSPAGVDSVEPNLAQGPDGTVVLSWLERGGDRAVLRFPTLANTGWQAAQTVASGDDWFVNWADFPSVVPITSTLWAAHWLVKRPGGTYAYDVAIALSHDSGRSWGAPLTPHTDGTRTEHGFVSLFPWQSGVGAIWLDGRNMVEDGDGQGEANDDHGHAEGGMTLRSAVIDADHTRTFEQLIDELVCDCCQTDVAPGPDGPIAVYRDRSPEEIRDIRVIRAVQGEWQPPQPVGSDGWEIGGCPVNGPAIATLGNEVAVAWLTAPGWKTRVRLARSNDGAESFSTPIDVDSEQSLGRVGVVLLDDGAAVVSWLCTRDDETAELCLRRVARSGETGAVQVVGRTGASRLSGFPQMLRSGQGLIMAWTDTSGDAPRVRTARVDATTL